MAYASNLTNTYFTCELNLSPKKLDEIVLYII